MTTEISGDEPAVNLEKTSKENRSSNTNPSGEEGVTVNGISNGYVDKHAKKEHTGDRDKHREKDKDRHRDKSRDKPREKDGKHGSSSSSKDKDKKHSSSSSSNKDKDKERRHKDERKDKDREHNKSLSSSRDKDKEHKSSSSSKDKEKDRHSSVNKDKSSSHKSPSSSSSNKDKDRHSSSSGKDKVKHSSSSGSGERKSSGDKDKHKSSKDKVKVKDEDRHKERSEVKEVPKVKQEEPEEELQEEATPGSEFDAGDEPSVPVAVKAEPEEDSEEDVPLWREHKRHRSPPSPARRVVPVKREIADEESEDDVPLMARKKAKKEKPSKKRKAVSDEEEEEDFKPERKKKKKGKKEVKKEVKKEDGSQNSPKKKKGAKDEAEVWKWWEEEKKESGVKWTFLEHKGPVFAPRYEPLPRNVRFYYNGEEMHLSEGAEEVATFYARMLEHDYVTKQAFNKNFFKDWRKQMTQEERETITDLSKCNFKDMHAYFVQKNEERKAMSKEEKKVIKEANEALLEEYGFCTIDGHKEKIGNFKIEPPGLFRGRGEHPKMGMLKKRVTPEEVIINCSKNSKAPVAPDGRKWKEVRHDNNVTWLASWTENVQGQVKYVMLNPSSKLKGEKDWQKYECARKLHKCIDKIRNEYRLHWKSKEMRIRQRSVALYFIDKLALRAGNEKDDDQADTVGCCSLRVEHISLHEEKNGKEWVVVFDFLGKDSIRYYNEVSVEKRVFKNLQLFMQNKATGDDLFDRLNTMIMNKHLSELMEGLTAKVFRTYNASITLQQQLNELTDPDMSVQEKVLAYNRANRAVAILCNHQRAVPKTFAKSMENMQAKIEAKQDQIREAEKQFKQAKRDSRGDGSSKSKIEVEKKRKALERFKEQMDKMNLQATDKEENKDIALGTSKLNYLDPRISVAWCKKHGVPIEKVYNKTQRSKFNWAIDMATEDYVF